VAYAVEQSIVVQRRDHLLGEKGKETSTDKGEVEVVEFEEEAELDGVAGAHELSTTKDDEVVHDQHRERSAICREVCLCLDELEVFRMVSVDSDISLIEDGP
jgi:hypothetical protein